ncbi:hypothetical protein B0I28_11277 [Glycomyces artemisiae]|uniref:Uncharacterized protein n=2 Tax=Glycomyces artemisiae TaxID=1076443 RepID=A0A2T0UCZ7_9ACTN|nr:hypothetical protein B0I28_11277 [Glycomyces artemisiae]
MQDLGFTIQHPFALNGGMVPDRFEGFASPYSKIPNVEQAESFGFGIWLYYTDTDSANEVAESPEYIAFAADELGWQDPSESKAIEEWAASDDAYQREWLESFMGAERLAFEENLQNESTNGLAFSESAEFSGCELKSIEAVYGEPRYIQTESGGVWSRPSIESPLTWVSDGDLYSQFSEVYAEEERDFLDCIERAGYGQWEFDEFGYLPIAAELSQLYEGASESSTLSNIQRFADAGTPEELKELEFALALDFSRCAEASGLRGAPEDAWARMYVEYLLPREVEVYAWEEQVNEYLANAQKFLQDPSDGSLFTFL